jgi:hypothetical protein|tara:strand:- start:98 stop:325 length:228 start_codon:yes stop_codon:yes gene_type:complete
MKMLEKIYENLSEKKLKQALTINYGILITSIALPVLFLIIGYFINGKIYFNYPLIIFLLLFIWSLFNVEFLKKKI